MTIKIFDKLPREAKAIHENVFIHEQGFSYDYDAFDEENCPHIGMRIEF